MPCKICQYRRNNGMGNSICPKCPEYGELQINPELSTSQGEIYEKEGKED